MSLRWRSDDRLLCAAKHEAEPGDTYIDDRLHYQLSLFGAISPHADEETTGEWNWVKHRPHWENRNTKYTKADIRLLRELVAKKLTWVEIGKRMKRWPSSVHRKAIKLKLISVKTVYKKRNTRSADPSPPVEFIRVKGVGFTIETEVEIWRCIGEGLSWRDTAKRLHVSDATLYAYRKEMNLVWVKGRHGYKGNRVPKHKPAERKELHQCAAMAKWTGKQCARMIEVSERHCKYHGGRG